MITLTAEQAQQIEEVLADIVRVYKFDTGTPVKALATIRAARAREHVTIKDSLTTQEQEPVAWYLDTFDEDGELEDREYNGINEFSCGRGNGTPLYAAPVRTKDLTDDVCNEIIKSAENKVGVSTNGWDCVDPRFIVRAVISADRENNRG